MKLQCDEIYARFSFIPYHENSLCVTQSFAICRWLLGKRFLIIFLNRHKAFYCNSLSLAEWLPSFYVTMMFPTTQSSRNNVGFEWQFSDSRKPLADLLLFQGRDAICCTEDLSMVWHGFYLFSCIWTSCCVGSRNVSWERSKVKVVEETLKELSLSFSVDFKRKFSETKKNFDLTMTSSCETKWSLQSVSSVVKLNKNLCFKSCESDGKVARVSRL